MGDMGNTRGKLTNLQQYSNDFNDITQLVDNRYRLTEWQAYLCDSLHTKVLEDERTMNESQRRTVLRILEGFDLA